MNKNKALILILILSVLIFSCRKKTTEWKGTVTEEDGVIVVNNPKEPMYGEEVFSLEEELSLGEAEGREEYMFSRILIDVDEEENIFVLNDQSIRVFDNQGEYLRTIGKKGQGPGELASPRTIQITPQNEIMIYDFGSRRLTFYSLDGEFLRHVSAATLLALIWIKKDVRGDIVASTFDIENKYIKKFSSDFESQIIIQSSIFEKRTSDTEWRVMPSLHHFDLLHDGKIVCGYSEKYEILIYSSEGNLVRKIIKEYDPVEISEHDKEVYIDLVTQGRGYPPNIKAIFPKFLHPFMSLSIDDEGRIFVGTYEKRKDQANMFYFDVFDSEGRYIAKVPIQIKDYRLPLVLKKNKLYVIYEDDDGYQYVKRFKVNWNI